jgi:hypothetical protein
MRVTRDCPVIDETICGMESHAWLEGEEEPIGLILCGSRGEKVVELLLSSQTNRLRVAQYLLPEDTAALKARLAQITAAYEELHEGASDGRGIRNRHRQLTTIFATYPSGVIVKFMQNKPCAASLVSR